MKPIWKLSAVLAGTFALAFCAGRYYIGPYVAKPLGDLQLATHIFQIKPQTEKLPQTEPFELELKNPPKVYVTITSEEQIQSQIPAYENYPAQSVQPTTTASVTKPQQPETPIYIPPVELRTSIAQEEYNLKSYEYQQIPESYSYTEEPEKKTTTQTAQSVQIGMPSYDAIKLWGYPKRVNKNIYTEGYQWCYSTPDGSYKIYVYMEDNTVTNIQYVPR